MVTKLSSKIDKLTNSETGTVSRELNEYAGLSSDTKPTDGLATGSSFIEVDTGDIYLFDGTNWVKQFSLQD